MNNYYDYVAERVIEVSRYIIETKSTVRKAAKMFGISKSTVYKDVAERLPKINPQMAGDVRGVLDINKAERHIRGGIATYNKYKCLM